MRLRSIPVAMYHHVNQHAHDFITVSVKNFRRQMAWLRREGYETLDAENFFAVLTGVRPPARRSVVLTFDDAWLDVHTHAFPVLKEFGHKFIVFVVSDWTEQASRKIFAPAAGHPFPNHALAAKLVAQQRAEEVICAWPHLREMQASGLASIENHTATHGPAARLTADELREDVCRCRVAIRENLGRESHHLCWPYGSHDRQSLRVAHELGLATTYLVRRGINLPRGETFAVKRFTVADRDESWLKRQLEIFSNPVAGFLYARLKPDRWFRRR